MSAIEWTDETWNPTTGCDPISPGCRNCYAFRQSRRLAAMGQAKYQGITGERHFNGVVHTHENELSKPLRWKKPRRVFVNSMSDLFHPAVPFDFVDQVFAVMALCPQHTFQLLTKRPARMMTYLDTAVRCDNLEEEIARQCGWEGSWPRPTEGDWPLLNVWLGTSVEDQQRADERIPHLLRCPAIVRFLSCEPLLGPVDLDYPWHGHTGSLPLCGWCGGYVDPTRSHDCYDPKPQIDWVIVGGESGPDARPMNSDWVRTLREQCQDAGVPFFFKQWGAWAPVDSCPDTTGDALYRWIDGAPRESRHAFHVFDDGEISYRVGKKSAGRLLDGEEWNEYPSVSAEAEC